MWNANDYGVGSLSKRTQDIGVGSGQRGVDWGMRSVENQSHGSLRSSHQRNVVEPNAGRRRRTSVY